MEAMVKDWTNERLEERFDAVDQRFDAVDQRFDAVDRRFDAIDRRFDTFERRVDADIRELRGEMKAGFDHVDACFHDMHRTIIVTTCSLMGTIIVGSLSVLATQL